MAAKARGKEQTEKYLPQYVREWLRNCVSVKGERESVSGETEVVMCVDGEVIPVFQPPTGSSDEGAQRPMRAGVTGERPTAKWAATPYFSRETTYSPCMKALSRCRLHKP